MMRPCVPRTRGTTGTRGTNVLHFEAASCKGRVEGLSGRQGSDGDVPHLYAACSANAIARSHLAHCCNASFELGKALS